MVKQQIMRFLFVPFTLEAKKKANKKKNDVEK